jgi:antirestriction protein ArdC
MYGLVRGRTVSLAAEYGDGLWGTYRQWQEAGAQVRQGERSTTVVLWRELPSSRQPDDNDGDDDGHRRMFARAFSVFNVAQVDGYQRPTAAILSESQRLAHAEAFISNLGIRTVFEGWEACYRPSTDAVFMPPFSSFRDPASSYGVWLHENGHASGAKHRLDRDLSGRFGSAAYAAEECCVEILSGLILADLGIAHHPRPDHAAYIASWLKVLKDDPRAIFTAASKAPSPTGRQREGAKKLDCQDKSPNSVPRSSVPISASAMSRARITRNISRRGFPS